MPSPESRSAGFFYMHSQNRFWPVMAHIFSENFAHKNNSAEKAAAIRERRDFLLRHKIALWDVLAECDITGASDASIKNAVPNDFSEIISNSQIVHIFCTGKTAWNVYRTQCAEKYTVEFSLLPSPSPANRALWPTEKLTAEYQKEIRPFL